MTTLTLNISDSIVISDSPILNTTPVFLTMSESTAVSDISEYQVSPFFNQVASVVVSGYKWLTQTLYNVQQSFVLRPYFTAQIIDDTIQPNAKLFSGGAAQTKQGSMAVAPDGTVFSVGVDAGVLKVWRSSNLNSAGGVFSASTTLDTTGDNCFDDLNNYSIAISDAFNGVYRITVWYFANFINDGSNLTIKMHYSDDGGLTFTKLGFTPASLPNNSIVNLSIASFKPIFKNDFFGLGMYQGCFYIKPNGNFNGTGYDIYYIITRTGGGGGTITDTKWYANANSYDWSIHSLGAFYLNGVQYCVFSGYRNILDSVNVKSNPNYAIWVTGLLYDAGTGTGVNDLWTQPIAIIPIGSASSTNQNSFTFPSASVINGIVYVTFNATIVDSVSQTSTGASAVVVTTHTNYMIVQSDDGTGFSYPSVFVAADGTEFNSGSYSSFILQNGFWYLGGALGWLWEYIQNNIVADVSGDVIGYNVQEAAGQPSAISLKIANANNKWVGAAPTGTGAAAIARNRKIALWQGYYNVSGTPEVIPHSLYYIDDILQQVSSTKNDVTLVGRDFYKKLKTTVTKFSYQFTGPTFFSDIFDGTLISNWNQIAGIWDFNAGTSIVLPFLRVLQESGGEDTITLVGSNQNSYGHLMRVFFKNSGSGFVYFYGFYIDVNNWLRLELNCTDGQSWAIVKNVAGVPTTLDSGTMPFTMSAVGTKYYGVFIRRRDYYGFTFMIEGASDAVGNQGSDYDPVTTSYVFRSGGSGEFDLSGTFSSTLSWQSPFTVGLGVSANNIGVQWRWFMFTTFNNSNNLGRLMRKIARIAGIFAFKISYTWRELLYVPDLTGTYTVNNRKITIAASNQAISNTNIFANGEISFRAKMTIANTAVISGFRFVFRGDSNNPVDAYYFHVIREVTATPKSTICRFERLSSSLGITLQFYNTGYDVSNNPTSINSLNFDVTKWHTYRVVMINGWFYAFIDDTMVASWNDNLSNLNYLTSGNWGFMADANTTLEVQQITAPDFWKPVQSFTFNPGDDAESAIESLLTSLRAWMFSDLLGRFKAIFLGSSNPSTYIYNSQLFEQNVDNSDKEFITLVTVYGNGVAATARNTDIMAGIPTRDVVLVDYTIMTQQDAQTRANNELINRNQYQNQYTPKQFINVGAEIFDAVTVTNIGSNTSGVNEDVRIYSQEFAQGGGNNNSDYSLQLDSGNL